MSSSNRWPIHEHLISAGQCPVELREKSVKQRAPLGASSRRPVTLVVPIGTRTEVARAFAISKLAWIKDDSPIFRNKRGNRTATGRTRNALPVGATTSAVGRVPEEKTVRRRRPSTHHFVRASRCIARKASRSALRLAQIAAA